jgi:hypothetical protein
MWLVIAALELLHRGPEVCELRQNSRTPFRPFDRCRGDVVKGLKGGDQSGGADGLVEKIGSTGEESLPASILRPPACEDDISLVAV